MLYRHFQYLDFVDVSNAVYLIGKWHIMGPGAWLPEDNSVDLVVFNLRLFLIAQVSILFNSLTRV